MERSSAEIVLRNIRSAFENGFDVDDPEKQISPTIKIGVKRLRGGKVLSLEDVEKIEKAGGTDHPDPWFG